MPYIDKKARLKLDRQGVSGKDDEILRLGRRIASAGEFNYVITRLALNYLIENGQNYQHMNDILGALEGCKLELYRRFIAPYEEKKIEANGDVTS